MDYAYIQQKAIQWMAARGWKNLWGKRGAFTQSLLQHTDIELNTLCTLLPILEEKAHYGLMEAEKQALIVGTIAHDTGKETPEWQEHIRRPSGSQKGPFVPHVIPTLTEQVVPELVSYFGFAQGIVPDAIAFVNLHMAATRTATNLMSVLTGKAGGSNRWAVLARIVSTIDNFCSIRGILPTLDAIRRDAVTGGAVGPHLRLGYHLLTLRGVSTTLLHRAAQDAYQNAGWLPLLYFSNGTIYVADGRTHTEEPTLDEVSERLGLVIEGVLPRNLFPKMVVGTPAATMIPKPELFDYREMGLYLREAARRVKRGSFLRKPETVRMSKMKDNKGGGYWQLSKKSQAAQNLAVDSERIDRAQPLMMIFKLFRDAMKPEVIGKAAQAHAASRYDAVFGPGTFARLQSTSTLMPAREMAAIIDPFLELPGEIIGLKQQFIELAPDNELQNALIAKLNDMAQEIYHVLPEGERPTRVSAAQIAASFRGDIIRPMSYVDPRNLAHNQRAAYIVSKPEAMRDRDAARLCPVCNSYFRHGTSATADFVVKPDSHTNRAVSHGYTGKVVICDACKYERFLQQLLLGEKVARVLALTPRMHVGYWAGHTFFTQAQRFYEEAHNLMSNSTTNPNQNITLALTNVIARKLLGEGEEGGVLVKAVREGLDGATLASLLTYSLSADNQKKYMRELAKALRDAYEFEEGREDIATLNEEWESSFSDWDSAIQAVFAGDVHSDIVDEVRARTYRLRPQFRIVCQTPNFILVPLISGFVAGKEESETNAALRELFILLLIGLALDCSVAAIDAGEPITFEGGEGVARVPAVPAVRDLVGSEWVGLTEAPVWLEKIGAASLLASYTAYPERSNLYQILKALTPGHVLRRIEMEQKQGASVDHPALILKALQEVTDA